MLCESLGDILDWKVGSGQAKIGAIHNVPILPYCYFKCKCEIKFPRQKMKYFHLGQQIRNSKREKDPRDTLL